MGRRSAAGEKTEMKDNYATSFAAKWPEDVANRGFAPVPKCLITCMDELGLKPQEAVVLFNIIEKCWKAGDQAWPSVDYIAQNVGRKNSATREILTNLTEKKFISKEQRFSATNLYGLEPAAEKLAKHMKTCRHSAGNLEGSRQKTGSHDSQKSSDYIEPEIIRNPDLESINNSHHFINEDDDDDNYSICMRNFDGSRHEWREFETEQVNDEGFFTRYYFTCIHCNDQYHKDGERPWSAEYPLIDN